MATRSRVQSRSNNLKDTKKTTVSRSNKKVIKKKRKIKFKAVFILFLILICVGLITLGLLSMPITNIYISGNKILSDQEIIDLAGLSNYPSSINNMSMVVEKRLEQNINIISAKVIKKWLTKVYIEVEENIPLFYNASVNKTLLYDGKEVDDNLKCATLVNYVPDTIYSKFVDEMKKVNTEILNRISEIKYDPNDVDTERFLILMNDGNYVYLTLPEFNKINSYINIIKNFEAKKGILYLDSGEYFKILEN